VSAHPDVQARIKAELAAAGLLHAGQPNCVTPRQARPSLGQTRLGARPPSLGRVSLGQSCLTCQQNPQTRHPKPQSHLHPNLAQAASTIRPCNPCLTPRQLTYEDLPRLHYLNAVVDETMR
jgi:hypothetical protein